MMIYRDEGLGPSAGYLQVVLNDFLDLQAVRDFRAALADAGDVHRVEVDFSSVRGLDASALRLLDGDMVDLERRGVSVVTRNVPNRIAGKLSRHPIRRFERFDDDLYTDPDLDRTGFLPSGR